MSSTTIYCTYITIYSGNKLPPFYIGSSSIIKINNGYRGSVRSSKYRSIWDKELKDNPHLFKTKIISVHEQRIAATRKELKLQISLNVVKSPMYVNMAYAAPNGFFGMSTKGIPKSEETRKKMMGNKNAQSQKGKQKSRDHRLKIAKALKGRIITKENAERHSKAMTGRHWWHDLNGNMRLTKECPGDGWTLGRC